MKAEEYIQKRLDPETEGYSLHERKKLQYFAGYDMETAFEEGQRNPAWIYDSFPEPGERVIADDLYLGPVFAHVDSEGEWRDDNDTPLKIDRWLPLPY